MLKLCQGALQIRPLSGDFLLETLPYQKLNWPAVHFVSRERGALAYFEFVHAFSFDGVWRLSSESGSAEVRLLSR